MSDLTAVTQMPRVLAIGQSAAVLDVVTEEVARCGIDVRGLTIDAALDGVEGVYDLVSFGAGVTAEMRRKLERQIRQQHAGTRFIRTYAPYAASQIVAAARQIEGGPSVDLDAYCRRIGYDGPLDPTLETLRALVERHLAAIPFEAIDVLLGRGIDISPAAVDTKLIGARRGGYCYEQNSLFKRVLSTIGFEVDALVASVRWMAEPGAPPLPRTHMMLRVSIDGVPWLADVGFGSAVPPAPLRLDGSDPQQTRYERYRVITFGAGLLLQADINERWQPLYDFSPEPMLDGHYELFNWFTATHPSSHFRRDLIVARTTAEARHMLLDNRLTIRRAHGGMERHYLSSNEIERALSDVFGLDVEPGWRPLIDRAAARGKGGEEA